ncbi:MAG TPA: hypothetical protein DDY78_14150 [Planctomycetales bacterium]|jgi:hypothetical protein|nr:hypothetical protein [Planctomycetales bacterium]
MKCRGVLYVDILHDLHHFSKIYTGLDLLARAGAIDLQVTPAPEHSLLQWVDVAPPDRAAPLRVAFDLGDHNDVFIKEGLDRCEVYFKRSYYPPHIDALPPEQRSKVLSFGLNYSCSSRSSKRTIGRLWAVEAARQLFCSPRRTLGRASQMARFLRQFLLQPDYRLFEQPPDAPVEPLILFQTRVWEPEETSENLEQINEERAALVRLLRKTFGARFRGGLVPTPFARQRYADVLLEEAYRRTDFIRMVKRNLIGVYTRGLHNSLAFKLPEYLAASMCIVSDPMRNQLPEPLVAGEHYLEFRDPDQCLAQCEQLLRHPDEVREMRRRNHDYYEQWVAPAQHLQRCLERAVQTVITKN